MRAGGRTLTLSLNLTPTLALTLTRCVQEARVSKGARGITLRQYGRKTYRMLQSRAMLAVRAAHACGHSLQYPCIASTINLLY